jgi:uncharacterized membrane protein
VRALLFYLVRASKAIWFLPTLFSFLAVAALVMSAMWEPGLPDAVSAIFNLDVVDRVLNILASSMLAVAIFSLTTMVASIQAASQAATPRVRTLLLADRTAQVSVSIFIGTFLFSLLGVIGLSTGLYGENGRLILFLFTLLIILAVVLTLIRWIQKLSHIGGMRETIDRAEVATRAAFDDAARFNANGTPHRDGGGIDGLSAISATTIGYVQYVDAPRLGRISEDAKGPIVLMARPGSYVDPTRALAYVGKDVDDAMREAVRKAFIVETDRTFDSDPGYGLIVLSEIASRALSPAVNDPGTAIDVIGTQTRLLDEWGAMIGEADERDPRYPSLYIVELDVDELFTHAFSAIARDGATMLEVQLRLQKGLATLAATRGDVYDGPARRLSAESLARAQAAMTYPGDVHALEHAAAAVGHLQVAE